MGLSIRAGDVQIIDGNWAYHPYRLTSPLLVARGAACGIHVEAVDLRFVRQNWGLSLCAEGDGVSVEGVGLGRWGTETTDPSIFFAACPRAEMRIAETLCCQSRLRKADGVGTARSKRYCIVPRSGRDRAEFTEGPAKERQRKRKRKRLRAQGSRPNCQIIRSTNSIRKRSKPMPSTFAGTKALRDATCEQVETFPSRTAGRIGPQKDRAASGLSAQQLRPPNQEVVA